MLGNRRSSRLTVAAATAAATLVALLATGTASAQAAISAPGGLSPVGAASSSTPTFSWNRVSGATGYQLMITSDSTQQQVANATTANNKWVPTNNLADGSYSWQVRATGPNGSSSWASASTTISPTAPPSPISPIGGQHLAQPDAPVLLKWSAVGGATGYEVQVDSTGTTWTNPTTYQVKGNSYFVDTPQAPGTWYWRVRAVRGSGLFTTWSSAANYVVDQLADPEAGADMNTGTPMQDVRIDWLPVDGATAYQLQVDTDPSFNAPIDDRTVDGTTYSPGTTYANDQYYWRVRAIDAGQNKMPWTVAQPFTFQRNWPQQPTLQYPLDQLVPAVGKPMYYQWTPVKHATRYEVQASTDSGFSPGTIHSCFTSGTTLSPFDVSPVNNRTCGPQGQGVTTYWRVRAIDDPKGVLGIYSAIHKYVYDSGAVTLTSPANGATVDVPTLRWSPTPETEQYEVVLRDKGGNQVADITTHSTSWTPESLLTAANSPYSWTVQSVDSSGSHSPLYPGRTFSVSGNLPTSGLPALTPLTGIASDPATYDFPSLSWVPKTGATYYRIRIGVAGSGFWDNTNTSHINGAQYAYSAATDTDTHYLAPGDYDWQVSAYDGSGQLGSWSSTAQFTIKQLADATGQQIALDGKADLAGHACDNALSNVQTSSQICTGVPATPVLNWNQVPGAAGYLVYLANDRELTNAVVNPYAVTTSTLFRPPNDLLDNTAQDSYYWYVRPCKSISSLTGCTADPASTNSAATNAFRKQSPTVQLQSPADTASVATDPAFTWSDYLDTNQQVSYSGGTDKSPQTARTYRIQISQSPTFNSTVDDREVDQPFYTPYDRTLPQGTLYWRVQAVDPAGNRLTWSPVRSFSNDQPAIDLVNGADTAPAIGGTTGGTPTFRWTPMAGASSYQIEVYRNNDTTHSDANRVLQATSRVPAFVWPNYLPTSGAAYRWRVRWFDADNQPRPWSSDATFTVNGSNIGLNSPPDSTFQPANGLYFTWDAAPFASAYQLTLRDAVSNNTAAQWTTAATAYAPDHVNDGSYEWRVSALDPNGNPIAVSNWRSFVVDTQGPVVTSATPNPTGTPKSKVKVAFNEKVLGVSTSSFVLHVDGRSSKLPAHVTVASNKRSATLTPNSHLKRGKTYTVKVTKAVHDAAGNHMTTYTWSFGVA
ncbi:MAG TPA: Ig-like domain-containing protein [Nocardioides sp.]|nr:Ig-like domain-containing protein [Nocardioides sp.]